MGSWRAAAVATASPHPASAPGAESTRDGGLREGSHRDYELGGFEAFVLPMVLYRLLPNEGHVHPSLKAQFRKAFAAGAAASFIGSLLRASLGSSGSLDRWGNVAGLALSVGIIYVAAALVLRRGERQDKRPRVVVGAATSSGYAVLFVAALPALLGGSPIPGLISDALNQLLWLLSPQHASSLDFIGMYLFFKLPRAPYGDALSLMILAPAAVALATFFMDAGNGRNIFLRQLLPLAILLATIGFAAPIYQGDLIENNLVRPMSWFVFGSDYPAIAYLSAIALAIAAWLYRRAWSVEPIFKT